MKRKERAFILQVLQEKNQESPTAGSTSPHPGKLRPTESTWDWELWVPTEMGLETQVCLQAGTALPCPLCGLQQAKF